MLGWFQGMTRQWLQNRCGPGDLNLMEEMALKKYSQINIQFQTARSGLRER